MIFAPSVYHYCYICQALVLLWFGILDAGAEGWSSGPAFPGLGGYLGALTSRLGFCLPSFRKWREEILLKEAQLSALAHLAYWEQGDYLCRVEFAVSTTQTGHSYHRTNSDQQPTAW